MVSRREDMVFGVLFGVAIMVITPGFGRLNFTWVMFGGVMDLDQCGGYSRREELEAQAPLFPRT
jgi:hypothetical protein